MKKLLLFVVLAFLCTTVTYGQSIRPVDLVKKAKQTTEATNTSVFQPIQNPTAESRDIFQNFSELRIQQPSLEQILQQQNEFIELEIPVNNSETVTLELVRVDIYQGNSHVVTEPGMQTKRVEIGQHYRGIIKGNESSIAAVSFFNGEISGMISGYKETNLVIGKMKNNNRHIIYSDDQILDSFSGKCATPDDGIVYKEKDLESSILETAALTDCVRLYLEVDYDIYQDKGSTQNVTNFVTGFMNQVMTVYSNENINTSLSPLVIWTESSPYSASDSAGMLSDFQSYRNSIDGDLGQLVSYQASGGIAAGFAGICASNTDDKQSFASIGSTYSNYPTYSYTVFVVSHEFGHTFGSRHTHACVWNGNGTAIDSCAGYTEGSCSMPGNPSGGGTIMSYCANTSVGIDMTKGFGTQPGNVIRNSVANGSCLQPCGTDPDPDPEPEDCVDGDLTLTIQLDNYPEETSWIITNSNGSQVASGGTYGSQADGSTVSESISLNDGEYTFTISDEYGDGICCSYGQGNYTLESDDGTTIASGGDFGNSESTGFCIENTGGDSQAPSAPTGLSVTGTTSTTVNLDWNNSTDNVGVAGYTVYLDGSEIGNVSGSQTEVTGLSENTTYSFYVTAFDDAGNESSQSNTVNATTGGSNPAPTNYCDSYGNNANYEWIDLVELNNLSNSSGSDNGYADNTNMTASLPYGSNTLYISAGFSGRSYREYWSIWIDYNQDGTFSSSEEIISGSSTSSGTLSATFTVPSSAASGQTRMRVQMKYGSDGNSCSTFNYGEVEDYTVNIGASYNGSSFVKNSETLSDSAIEPFTVYPNPVITNQITVSVPDFDTGEYSIVNSYGKIVQQGSMNGNRELIQLNNLAKGFYVIRVSNGERKLARKIVIQ